MSQIGMTPDEISELLRRANYMLDNCANEDGDYISAGLSILRLNKGTWEINDGVAAALSVDGRGGVVFLHASTAIRCLRKLRERMLLEDIAGL